MYGKRIKKLRLEEGFKQKDLAEKLGISASSVGMYEREERQPDAETLKTIADFFDVSVDYILGNSNKRDHKHLTAKDKRDISRTLDELADQIEVTKEDAELLIDAIELALKRIKKKNKEKYTPNKYKNNLSDSDKS